MVFQGRVVFEEELKNDIFANSLIGTTIQDSDKRERSDITCLFIVNKKERNSKEKKYKIKKNR